MVHSLGGARAGFARDCAVAVRKNTMQMDSLLPATDRIIVLAGKRYREFLMDHLRQRAKAVDVPMERLPIGKQLQYLSKTTP